MFVSPRNRILDVSFVINHRLDEAILRLSLNDPTPTTLDLFENKVGDEGAGRLAEALITLTTLELNHFYNDPKTRRLVNVHLDRNNANLEKRSSSLFSKPRI